MSVELKDIDTEAKAYFLGCLVSKNDNVYNTPYISEDIRHFVLNIWHKLKTPIPDLPDNLKYHFVRGVFERIGIIANPEEPFRCVFASEDKELLLYLQKIIGGKILPKMYAGVRQQTVLAFNHTTAIDFLSKLYDNSTVHLSFGRRDTYFYWKDYVAGLTEDRQGDALAFRWQRTTESAVPPYKEHSSDSGYDLTLISLVKKVGNMEMYDTGIKVQPPDGWYFKMVGRSSIIKSGYILANSVGIIDRAYTGTIRAALIKIDPSAEIVLPCRLVQIVPCPIVHMLPIEVSDVESTERGDGGFGSSGR